LGYALICAVKFVVNIVLIETMKGKLTDNFAGNRHDIFFRFESGVSQLILLSFMFNLKLI